MKKKFQNISDVELTRINKKTIIYNTLDCYDKPIKVSAMMYSTINPKDMYKYLQQRSNNVELIIDEDNNSSHFNSYPKFLKLVAESIKYD